jgi:hypothetical protein
MEALVAAAGVFAALFTWNHEQRQRVINDRFNSIKARLQESENQLKELPEKYVLKSDLNAELDDIRVWLRSINDKLDRLIMTKVSENN